MPDLMEILLVFMPCAAAAAGAAVEPAHRRPEGKGTAAGQGARSGHGRHGGGTASDIRIAHKHTLIAFLMIDDLASSYAYSCTVLYQGIKIGIFFSITPNLWACRHFATPLPVFRARH